MQLLVGAAICVLVVAQAWASPMLGNHNSRLTVDRHVKSLNRHAHAGFVEQPQPHTKDILADAEAHRRDDRDTSIIPEPATMMLLAAGLLGIARASRRYRRDGGRRSVR